MVIPQSAVIPLPGPAYAVTNSEKDGMAMRNGRVRVFLLRRRAVAAVGALVLAGAIFWAVSYPAGTPASAVQRQLPIYSVEREQKMCSVSFDAAWGDAKVRQFTKNCRTSLLCFYDSINASYLQQNLIRKVEAL